MDFGGKGDGTKGCANGALDDEMKKQAAFCKEHVPCEEEKKLLTRRVTSNMVFTKKVGLFRERHQKNDIFFQIVEENGVFFRLT